MNINNNYTLKLQPNTIVFHNFHNKSSVKLQGSISSFKFEKTIIKLKKNFNLLNADIFYSKLINGNLSKRDVSLSFDDGLKSQYDIAVPILNKYNINYVIGDFTNMPFDDNSFDIVSCVSVIEHMPKDTQLIGIKEMARVVKPGGKLIITYDNYVDLTESFIHNSSMNLSDSVYFKTPDDLYENNFPDVIGICLTKGEN